MKLALKSDSYAVTELITLQKLIKRFHQYYLISKNKLHVNTAKEKQM